MSYRANVFKKIRRILARNFLAKKSGNFHIRQNREREQMGRVFETKMGEFISMRTG